MKTPTTPEEVAEWRANNCLDLIEENLITDPPRNYYEEIAIEHLRYRTNWITPPAYATIGTLKRLPFDFASKIKQKERFELAKNAMEHLICRNFNLPADFQFEDKWLKDLTAFE